MYVCLLCYAKLIITIYSTTITTIIIILVGNLKMM